MTQKNLPVNSYGDALHAMLVQPGRQAFPNLVDSLYDLLWKRIVNLEFPSGTRLSDLALAKELDVSRTPVREALYRLTQDGLVRVNARRGFFVATIDQREASEIFDVRIALEVLATRLATPLLSDEEIAEHVERQRRARERGYSVEQADVDEYFYANLKLHDMLLQRAGNRKMLQILANLKAQLLVINMHTAQVPGRRLQAIEEHERLLSALVARDSQAAALAMETHLYAVKERVLGDFYATDSPQEALAAQDFGKEGLHERYLSLR